MQRFRSPIITSLSGITDYVVFFRGIQHQINTEKRHFQPDPLRTESFFCEIVVPVEISIPARFYCFMATRLLTADIQSCQKTRFFLTQVVLENVA
jgi:hypothetical protein